MYLSEIYSFWIFIFSNFPSSGNMLRGRYYPMGVFTPVYPKELPTEIGEMSPSEKLNNLENHVHKSLVEKLGVKPTSSSKAGRKTKPSPQQKKLRHLKKELKRQFKQALKNGDNVKAKKLKKDFHKITQLHNNVWKLELKKHEKTSSSTAQQNFRNKPHQFAKKLLNQSKSRMPSFQKNAASSGYAVKTSHLIRWT